MKPQTYADISILSMAVFAACFFFFGAGWSVAPKGSGFGAFDFLGIPAIVAAIVGFVTQFMAIRGFKREDANKA